MADPSRHSQTLCAGNASNTRTSDGVRSAAGTPVESKTIAYARRVQSASLGAVTS